MTQAPHTGSPPAVPLAPGPIDLEQFAEIVNNARTDNNSAVIASSSGGDPDVGLKGSMMVWDRDHLAYWERTLRETYAAIKANPKVAVMVRNPIRDRRTLRFYGECRIVEDPALREQVWERVVQVEKDADKEKKGSAILIRIDRVRAGPEIQRRGA